MLLLFSRRPTGEAELRRHRDDLRLFTNNGTPIGSDRRAEGPAASDRNLPIREVSTVTCDRFGAISPLLAISLPADFAMGHFPTGAGHR
ncbi:hypothetical protein [Streptomyces sp. P9-A2]|uniref:hypothetical protein n=1 Tax=Streptomyces sp. P9-A2 TaxID=3072284 RepID=UPI002FC8B570